MLEWTRCRLPWHSMPSAKAIGIESSRSRSKNIGQSSVVWSRKLKETSPIVNAPCSRRLGVDCLGTRCRVQRQSVSSPHEQGAIPSGNLRLFGPASSKKRVPSLKLHAREDSVSIALALDAGCKGNRYRVLTIKEQLQRAIFGCLVPQAQRNKSHRQCSN